jgi:hypothetical protein
MISLNMTEQEAAVLSEVLESALSDLVTEAASTENRELRMALKEKKSFIREMLAKLAPGEEKRSA